MDYKYFNGMNYQNRSSMQSFRGLTSNGDCYRSKRPRRDDHEELLKIRRQV